MSNDRPDGRNRRRTRVVAVLLTALLAAAPVGGAVAVPAGATAGAQSQSADLDRPTADAPPQPAPGEATQQAQRVDSCTVIDEPGRYELASDLRNETADVCIHVRASDVVLDGNGHAVTGSGTNDSIGVLVYNGTPGSSVARNDTLSGVTVRNLSVSNWATGVTVGDIAGIDTQANVRNVVARNNSGSGVRMTEVDGGGLRNVTATGNQNGLTFWEVSYVTAENVNASGNDQMGFGLYQNVEDSTFRNVTAVRNGPQGYASAGMYLSTDAVRNVVEDAYFANNSGAGVRFSDSFQNVLRDVVIESNANRGIFGTFANGESLQNVTVRSNGGPEVELSDGGLRADGLQVGRVASLTFQDERLVLEPFDTDDLSTPLPGREPAERGIDVSTVRGEVTLTFDYDPDAAAVLLWRYDGTDWVQVDDTSVNQTANTITGSISEEGRVLPVEVTVNESSGGDSGESDAANGTGVSGTNAPFEIESLREDADFSYEFVVDGTVEPHTTDDISADSGDEITESDDGTVTVTGSTGDASGDAFLVSGEIVRFELTGVESGYVLTFDGEDVTATLTRDAEPEPVSHDFWRAALLAGTDVAFGEVPTRVVGT
jgi:hypothetical protein